MVPHSGWCVNPGIFFLTLGYTNPQLNYQAAPPTSIKNEPLLQCAMLQQKKTTKSLQVYGLQLQLQASKRPNG